MTRDAATKQRLNSVLAQIDLLTKGGTLHWERQVGSAHRYARWNNNLLILGPAAPLSDDSIPRYLFVTPFDSPHCIEINSNDTELGAALMSLVRTVETSITNEMPTDPFAVSADFLERLTS